MTSAETPAASSHKCSASGWQKRTVMILGIAFWIMLGAYVTLVLKKPKQYLQIANTGSQSVDIRCVSAPWCDDKTLRSTPPGIPATSSRPINRRLSKPPLARYVVARRHR